jgi:hypothetical protein
LYLEEGVDVGSDRVLIEMVEVDVSSVDGG